MISPMTDDRLLDVGLKLILDLADRVAYEFAERVPLEHRGPERARWRSLIEAHLRISLASVVGLLRVAAEGLWRPNWTPTCNRGP